MPRPLARPVPVHPGERYGSFILPPQVSAALIGQLVPHLTTDERQAFYAAYRLDENAVPPEYVLLRAEGPERKEDERLRLALARAGQAAGVAEAERLLFEGSATHREIQLGLLGEPPGTGREGGVLCAVRSFAGNQVGLATKRFAAQDPERAERVRQLTEAVLARLPGEQVRRYEVAWDGERGPAFDKDALAEAFMGLLRPKLEAVIAGRTAARAASAAQGRDAVALANAIFERERAERVEGRTTELARLAAYLEGREGARQPLVVTGVPGSGKSTLLAEAAKRATEAQLLAKGLAPRTVQHIHSTLKQALENAARLSLVQRNVCALVDPPKAGRPERKFLTVEQAEAFLVALKGDRLEALFVLALNTALRQGELLALTWGAVDLHGEWLRVGASLQRYSGHKRIKEPKTAASRRGIPLTRQALAALRAQRVRQVAERLKAGDRWEEHDLVFPNPWGRPANHRPVTDDHFKPALRRAGLPDIRFHDMRHTCASFLVHQGVNMKVISQILGHSGISVTMDVYAHLLPGDERTASQALDRLFGS